MGSTSREASSGSSQMQNSGSESDLHQAVQDQRKRKRMMSNRESARRSRMRKQKHLDDLMVQVSQLRNENSHILANINLTNQLYGNVESENLVLRAQMDELTHRLNSLNEIVDCMNSMTNDNNSRVLDGHHDMMMINGDDFLNPWNLMHVNQPVLASPDVFLY